MGNEEIVFELLDRSDLDSVVDMIKSVSITDGYRREMLSVATWMFESTTLTKDNTVDDGMKLLRSAKQKLDDSKKYAANTDLLHVEFLNTTMLSRYKRRLVKTIEGCCPDCIDW